MKAFVIFRDRVTYVKNCVAALDAAGLDVYVVDHGSSWPAALAWLAQTQATVLRRGGNAYPWQLWEWGPFRDIMLGDPEPYVVTDPDVVPSRSCPADWPVRLGDVLARSGSVKVGLGLRLDKLPPSRRKQITAYEYQFWADEWEEGVFRANTDTTLALYRPFTEYPLFALGPSLRTGWPYVANHLAWYEDSGLSPELRHYYSHADAGHNVTRSVKG